MSSSSDVSVPLSRISIRLLDPSSSLVATALSSYYNELSISFSNGFHIPPAEDRFSPFSLPYGCFLVAYEDTSPIKNDRKLSSKDVLGCGGLQKIDQEVVEIKRMWVRKDIRGIGLGKRLLDALERAAIKIGYKKVRLDTNQRLESAISMYKSAGYLEIERYNNNLYAAHWFEKVLCQESNTWEDDQLRIGTLL